MKRFTLALLSALLITTLTFAQTTVVNVTWTWTPPATGSAVHHYVVQTTSNGTTWTTITAQPTSTSLTLPCQVGVNIQIRVAGVDAQGRQGIWSEMADPFVPDAGVPGAPGKPARTP